MVCQQTTTDEHGNFQFHYYCVADDGTTPSLETNTRLYQQAPWGCTQPQPRWCRLVRKHSSSGLLCTTTMIRVHTSFGLETKQGRDVLLYHTLLLERSIWHLHRRAFYVSDTTRKLGSTPGHMNYRKISEYIGRQGYPPQNITLGLLRSLHALRSARRKEPKNIHAAANREPSFLLFLGNRKRQRMHTLELLPVLINLKWLPCAATLKSYCNRVPFCFALVLTSVSPYFGDGGCSASGGRCNRPVHLALCWWVKLAL